MSGRKQFDTDVALDRAMHVFWQRGYADASLDLLASATGLGRGSIYGAFGSKDALFRACLERYSSIYGARYEEALAQEPEDPVLARLFPTAYPADPEAAAEFRRFTEGTLRDGKAQAAIAIIDGLEEAGLPSELKEEGLMIDVELDEAEAETWMRSFTDLRLALATRLGVEEGDEDVWAAMPDDDPRGQAHDIYDWVGYLQETLVHALSSR